MPLSISDFKNWAAQNRNTAVTVDLDEGAVKMSGIAPNKAGGWDASDRMNKRSDHVA